MASLHAQESLAGALLAQDSGATAVGEALAVLSEVRAAGAVLAVLPEARAAGEARADLSGVRAAGEVPADLSEVRAAAPDSVRRVAGSDGARRVAEPESARRAAGFDSARCVAESDDVRHVAEPDVARHRAVPDAARHRPALDVARLTADPDDARLIARHPVLLSLLPPSLGPRPPLPARTAWAGVPRGTAALPPREGLRLRIRWVQEMQASMVREIAHRFTAAGLIDDPSRAALLRWSELTAASDGAGLPADLPERLPRPHRPALPAVFRLAAGCPVPEPPRRGKRTPGQGAGGGYGSGTAWHGTGTPPRHAILIVRTLDPSLAPLLPGLTALVAETGSVLSHLAVLAREYRVPTAVGVRDALDRFPEGTRISVDGGTGEVVRRMAMAEATAATGMTSVPEATGPAESATTGTPHPPLARATGGTAMTDVADGASGVDPMSRPEAAVSEVPPPPLAPDAPARPMTTSGPDASPSSPDDTGAAPPDRTDYRPNCPDYREGMAS
ncbi:hypothetical protein JGB26_33915 [Streptomyces flavofungini]|uniref:PEP-utilising enzyme mobile domain-containing protein n=1 Tax=Streptomyces flavofungini TaxID=68200 RepID=A0ABS0XC42_9ACTN|nr:hypothetical protein [Streptomyces flavofungini]MBJ3812023.1 hypothetical protein [Streptomyces flavofungini]